MFNGLLVCAGILVVQLLVAIPAAYALAKLAFKGRSLFTPPDPDRAVLTVWNGGAAIRQSKYRMIRYADGQTQLFDITQDFWQQTNLGPDHPAHAPMLASLIATSQDYGGAVEVPA